MSMKRNWENNGQRVRQELLKKDAVIFDLDGTLVDSMWMWKAIDIEYLRRYGHECPDFLQREIEGMSFSETAVYFKETFRLPDTVEEIKQAWVDMSIEKYRWEASLKGGGQEVSGVFEGVGNPGRDCHQQWPGDGGCGDAVFGAWPLFSGGCHGL